MQSLAGHQDWVFNVAFSPDGRRIASAGADGAIKIWEIAGGQEPYTLRGHTQHVTCVAFSPDGRRLASTSSDQTIKLWDAAADPEAITLARRGGTDRTDRLLPRRPTAPGGRKHRGRDGTRPSPPDHPRRDRQAGGASPRLCQHRAASDRTIDGIAIRPDGGMVAAVSQYGGVEAWTVPDGQSCFRYDEPTNRFQAVAFSPDGRILAAAGQFGARSASGEALASDTGANGLVIAFDLQTGEILWRIVGDRDGHHPRPRLQPRRQDPRLGR